MNLNFSSKIEFPSGEIIPVDFTAEISEYHGEPPELDKITFDGKFSKEEEDFLNSIIEDDDLIETAWCAYNNQ